MPDTILNGNWTVHYASDGLQQRLEYTGSSGETNTLNQLYSALQDLFDEPAQMDELIPMSLAADQLIPVVDDEGKLVGEVHRTELADKISGNRNGDGAAEVSNGGVMVHDPKETSLLPSLSGTEGRPIR